MALTVDASAASGPGQDVEALRGRVAEILAREGVPGAGIALVGSDGQVWTGGVGVTDRRSGVPVVADTAFRVGSISKSVTAIAMMRLVEQGRLSLDARLADLAPEVSFENPWEAGDPVRLDHLLEHTAGFEFARFNEWFDDRAEPRSLLEALRVNPRSRRSRWPPGARFAYSNEGYLVAGYLLEQATGLPFDDAVRSLALEPLGMGGAAFRATPALRAHLAQGHGWPEPSGAPVVYEEDMMRPAANLAATPRDMARLVAFFLGRGTLEGHEILSPASVARMEARRTLPFAGPDDQYGLGVELFQQDGFVGRGHVGMTFGFEAAYRYLPEPGVGWAVLLNGGGAGARRAREAIEAEILAFLTRAVRPPPPQEVVVAPEELARLAGFYRDVAPDQELVAPLTTLGGVEISAEPGGLVMRPLPALSLRSRLPGARSAVRLFPAGGGAFRREGETASSFLFARTRDGEDAVVTGNGILVKASGMTVSLAWWSLVIALCVLLSALALLPHVLVQWWFRESASRIWVEILPSLSALTTFTLLGLVYLSPQQWGRLNATTVSFWALSWLYLPLSLLALAGALVHAWGPGGIWLKAYTLVVGLCGLGLAMFAWRAGWIGLRTWRW
jgi:CubicO group peptidase (beta-lactamase class C family)